MKGEFMTVREDVKSILAKESVTITELAEKMSAETGKNYDEFKLIIKILGYEINLKKQLIIYNTAKP